MSHSGSIKMSLNTTEESIHRGVERFLKYRRNFRLDICLLLQPLAQRRQIETRTLMCVTDNLS